MTQSTLEQARTNAMARFADNGPSHINCAQTIVAFALEMMGEDPELVVIARYFGGGMEGTGKTCGAVTGAGLALGLRDHCQGEPDGERRASTTTFVRELSRYFTEEYGTTQCAELTGHDLSTREGFESFIQSGVAAKCHDYVAEVCNQLGPMLV